MDSSNLATYSLPALRDLAFELGIAGFKTLSRPQLVPRLAAEIALANKALGAAPVSIESAHEVRRSKVTRPASRSKATARFGRSAGVSSTSQLSSAAADTIVDARTLQRWRRALANLRSQDKVWADGPAAHLQLTSAMGDLPTARPALSATVGAAASHLPPGHGHIVADSSPGTSGPDHDVGAKMGVDVDRDFECLAQLPMHNLQRLCEEMGVRDALRLPKHAIISRLLSAAYGLTL
jgi:hypothetical protein